jgi:hypothetical protein
VLGNHDFAMNTRDEARRVPVARQVRAALEATGVVVLHNQAATLRRPTGAVQGLRCTSSVSDRMGG